MTYLPHSVIEHLKQTLLGRLQLKVYEQIGGSPGHEPTPLELRQWLLRHLRTRWEVGLFYHYLLKLDHTAVFSKSDLPEVSEFSRALVELEQMPTQEPVFIEIQQVDDITGDTAPIGALVYMEGLKPSGHVCVVMLIQEAGFPNVIAGRLEVRASADAPEPAFSILSASG